LITGGAAGIGRAIVSAFAGQGAKVVFLDNDERAGAETAQAVAASCAGSVEFLPCDVTDISRLQATVAAAAKSLGGLHVLVNNAANDSRHALEEVTPELWDACMDVNLKHQFFASQAAYPAIAASGGGSIICLGSIAWLNHTAGMVGYTTAKAGIHGLVRTLARLLGPMNIRVNALLPGWTMTERQLKTWIDAEAEREIERSQCLPGRVMPDDVARMALFLGADDSAMCAQQIFIVDGGWV
jgi:NAD(P)-dependent dehydrogenase (short-subunit alcohol dehydrogenase family)